MRMEPTFEKANEIYFRLGIIYKQQQKFNQSLDVCILSMSPLSYANPIPVLQIHSHKPTSPVDRGRHLVSDWPRLRAAEGGESYWAFPICFMSLTILCSLILQRAHIVGCLSVTPTTQRFFSNSAGCTTSRAPTTLVRNRLSSTLRNQWLLVSVVFSNIGHVH